MAEKNSLKFIIPFQVGVSFCYAPRSKDRGHIVFVLSVCVFVCQL